MLYIDVNTEQVKYAESKHWNFFHCKIINRLTGAHCLNKNCKVCTREDGIILNSSQEISESIRKFFIEEDTLKKIIIGEPQILYGINLEFGRTVLPSDEINNYIWYFVLNTTQRFHSNTIIDLIADLQIIFDYHWFIGLNPNDIYSAYHLAEKLDRRTCTYCNRVYTTTMVINKKKKVMRPQLDHWFPQLQFPLLALSFYNLIPCCGICNSSAKRGVVLNLKEYVHPYIDVKQTEKFSFDYYLESFNKYHIFLKPMINGVDNPSLRTLEKLKINEMYNTHHDELKDIEKIVKAYSISYIKKMQELFPNSGLTRNEVYRLLFGTELDTEDFHKRPLSKFKRDILKKLNIVN